MFLRCLQQTIEVHFEEIDLLFQVELRANLRRNNAHTEQLLAVHLHRQSLSEQVVLHLLALQRVDIQSEATQQLLSYGTQSIEIRLLGACVPRLSRCCTRNGNCQTVVLRVGSQRVLLVLGRLVIVVAVTELIEFQVAIAVVHIELNSLQRIEQQRLAHYVQIGAQRIHNANAILCLIALQALVIRTLSE